MCRCNPHNPARVSRGGNRIEPPEELNLAFIQGTRDGFARTVALKPQDYMRSGLEVGQSTLLFALATTSSISVGE